MSLEYTAETRTFESVLATTLDSYRASLEDNIFKSHPLYDMLRSKGMVIRQDGGASIIQPIIGEKNSTIAWYRGYDVINLTPQDPFSVAKYDWTQLGGSISIDRLTMRKNSGRHQLINLVTALIQNAEESMIDKFMTSLYDAGRYNESQTSKQIAGLKAIVADSPNSYDVGGVDTSVNTFWQNKVEGNGAANWTWIPDLGDTPAAASGPKALAKLYNNCSKGPGGSPDIALVGQYLFQEYEAGLHPFKRYNNEGPAAAGFDQLRFRGMTIFWDEYINSENVTAANAATAQELGFLINSKYLMLVIDAKTDMILSDWLQPETQDARTKHILWMGNLVTGRRKKHGHFTYANVTDVT